MTPADPAWGRRARQAARRLRRVRGVGHRTAIPEPVYPVPVAVLAGEALAAGLAPHWLQVRLDQSHWEERVARHAPSLVVVELPDPAQAAWWGRDVLAWAAAHDVPSVLWDTSPAAGERLDRDAVLALARHAAELASVAPWRVPGYAAELPGRSVRALSWATSPAEHLPGGRTGRRGRVVLLPSPTGPASTGDPGAPSSAYRLAAAGTALVSAPDPVLEDALDGAVWSAAGEREQRDALAALRRQPEVRDRQALRARRAVLERHTWAHRAAALLAATVATPPPADLSVTAVVPTRRPHQVDHVLRTVAQQHGPRELVLVTHGFTVPEAELRARAAELGLDDVRALPAPSGLTLGGCLNLGLDAASGRLAAKMDDDNDYGPHYLGDLARELLHSGAQVVGKWTHYVHLAGSDAVLLRFAGHEHQEVDLVQGGTILARTDLLRALRFADLPRRVDTTLLEQVRRDGGRVWSSDRYNFVSRRGAQAGEHTWTITDQQLLVRASRVVFYGDPVPHATV